ncbi:transglutaminase family protein [Planctomycetota bacterium]
MDGSHSFRGYLLPAALLAVLAFDTTVLSQEQGTLVDEGWYVSKFLGEPSGYLYSVVREIQQDGVTVVCQVSKTVSKSIVRGTMLQEEETLETWSTPDGELIRMSESGVHGPQREALTVDRDGRLLKVAQKLNEIESRKTLEIPEGTKVTIGMDGWLLKRLGLEVGRKHELTVFSDSSKKLVVETTVVEGRRIVIFQGKECNAYTASFTVSDMPGVTAKLVVTPDGKMLSMKALTFEVIRTTKEEALAAAAAPAVAVNPYIELKGGVPILEGLESITVVMEVSDDTDGKIVSSSDYQKVKASIGRYEIELLSRPAPEESKSRLPIFPESKEFDRYTRPAMFVQSDHDEIAAVSKKALGGEKKPMAAVRKLCRWVFEKLKKDSPKTGMASALETLRNGTGDCSEHAVLFCALARSAGIPSREAFGLAVTWPSAGYHAWSEVYIDGQWVVVDASNNTVGVVPAYMLFGHSDGSHEDVSDSTSSFARIFAKATCAVTAAVRRGERFDPRDPLTFSSVEKDVYRNLLFDLSLDVSGGWKVRTHGPMAVQARGPDGAMLVISAVVGNLPSEQEWKTFTDGFTRATGVTDLKELGGAVVSGRPARAYSFVLKRGEKSANGRLRVVVRGLNVYTLVTMGSSELGLSDKALSEPFDRVTIGPEK